MDHDARVRDQFTRQAGSIANDALGLGTVRREGRVPFHQPAVVLAATVPEERA